MSFYMIKFFTDLVAYPRWTPPNSCSTCMVYALSIATLSQKILLLQRIASHCVTLGLQRSPRRFVSCGNGVIVVVSSIELPYQGLFCPCCLSGVPDTGSPRDADVRHADLHGARDRLNPDREDWVCMLSLHLSTCSIAMTTASI